MRMQSAVFGKELRVGGTQCAQSRIDQLSSARAASPDDVEIFRAEEDGMEQGGEIGTAFLAHTVDGSRAVFAEDQPQVKVPFSAGKLSL